MEDLKKALTQLSNLRCCDNEGITAEMIKYSSDEMKTEILKHFNKALHSGEFANNWHHTIFRMLPKDGDTTQLKNWHPIAILPIMYRILRGWYIIGYHRLYFLGNLKTNMLLRHIVVLKRLFCTLKLLLSILLNSTFHFGC